jgi:hypothetical protein
MSNVSHFQRFSQRENHVTNNTLLVLRYFYQAAPFKLERVLNGLLEDELSVGLAFQQQVPGAHSVPDAVISQSTLRIFVETKLGNSLWDDQIKRHVESIAASRTDHGERAILIGLTKESIRHADLVAIETYAKDRGITFKAITFVQIVESLRTACAEYEQNLVLIVEDYQSFLEVEGLLHDRNKRIAVFPCGTSYTENKHFGVYYEPPSRPSKRGCRFIGIYKDKTISLVGEIDTILICSTSDGKTSIDECDWGAPTDDHLSRIGEVIAATKYYDLTKEPVRFYLVHQFHETNVRKASRGGILRMRYFDLADLIGTTAKMDSFGAEEVATRLRDRTFE